MSASVVEWQHPESLILPSFSLLNTCKVVEQENLLFKIKEIGLLKNPNKKDVGSHLKLNVKTFIWI